MSDTNSGSAGGSSIIGTELVSLDVDLGSDKNSVIAALAERLAANGRASDADALTAAVLEREAKSATGLPGGIAIPHARSEAVTTPSLGFARLSPKADFGAPDGPADLVFLIAAPEGAGGDHMKLLTALARALVRPDFVASLRAAASADEVIALVEDVLPPRPESSGSAPAGSTAAPEQPSPTAAAKPAVASPQSAEQPGGRTIVAVTACPTGIAHTYMAADALAAAGERAGVTVRVETQGSSGSTPLPPDVIAGADAVIFATDVGVKGRERFAGKPVIASGVKRAINEPDTMVDEALRAATDPSARTVEGTAGAPAGESESGSDLGWGTRLRQILLTGVSYMIPFVAAGGLLIALGFLLAGPNITDSAADIVLDNTLTNLPEGGLGTYLGAVLYQIGSLAFSFLVPALAGYIAFAIADRPGLAPGFTAGAVAVFVGAGFIGGLVGGIIAGFAALWVGRIPLPTWARGLMPVVIIPLLASLIVGGLMFLLLGRPLAAITTGLTDWLNGLSGGSAVLLGAILGLMMCFDLGGPVNKAAYAFAVAGLDVANTGSLEIMAAVMAAGMVPPLAMALSSLVRPRLYSTAERENGKAAWLLGASFISEGAIPFAAADPFRVIPSMMLGGAVTGGIVMATGVTLTAPHGGLFVLFAMDRVVWFLIALAAGTVVAALAVSIAKSITRPARVAADEANPQPVAARS
ncbi:MULTISPECIES: PTS fructose transporter subunit IIABC [Rhodococcus]|uniref:PTS fructose transporter subunit IIABC n=1 Tax=Rhodococcus TaxID=1827 RepID=UPI001E2E38FE|nr:fructose-specific PTS transporter subunit EIIC [Rhodococcus pyridinivorans]MCD2115402.1 fructose-specific PTS transporter subunit EIIC [Rhodococcus pyridinivorans]MCZ4624377.1 fructose-specific PTS transporter subunit EIIC [Rhodococcus pyridinivorans]MCZ4645589.1 fructose-specific PTS transporter subunit EIIC [Rhodococcus pyridinivorans]MDJ0480411.1 fructose-specific PTS transporter subunit EIIC [Rhodococcus pyridinivorans]MDV7251694.1 fructose-specific PTS transporter subunit EIIC [Rhodoco